MKHKLEKTGIARKLRRNMTDAERRIWNKIRKKQLGIRFRRQQQIGDYIVDFVCLEHKLVGEIDGGQHSESERDERRDDWLRREGYEVVRFWNSDVLRNADGVLAMIRERISPSP